MVGTENCISDVRAWMREDKLMLNDNKTEFVIIGTERQLLRVPVNKIKIGQAEVSPVSSVRNLGTWFDSHLDMSTHVTKAWVGAFSYLYNIRHIRKSNLLRGKTYSMKTLLKLQRPKTKRDLILIETN